jgi:hypothetical protein
VGAIRSQPQPTSPRKSDIILSFTRAAWGRGIPPRDFDRRRKEKSRKEKSPFEDRSELEEMTLVNLPKIFDQTEEVRYLTANQALTFTP